MKAEEGAITRQPREDHDEDELADRDHEQGPAIVHARAQILDDLLDLHQAKSQAQARIM